MFLFFTILSKLMLILCGMLIGAWIECGYTHLILIGIIASIILHFTYSFMAKHYIKAKNKIRVRKIHYGDDKPDEIPDEVWEKVQALLQVTACPDKLEPTSNKDYEDKP